MTAAAEATPDADELIVEGRKHLRSGKVDLAAAHFAKAVEANPTSVEGHELAARCAFAVKDHAKAEEHFRRAAQCDSRRVEPLVNLGAVQNVRKDFAGAIKTLQKAVAKKAGRTNAQAYYNLGIAYRGAGQSSMAVQAYREAIRLNSDFAEAHQNLGNAYLDQNNVRQAKASFERALELNPKLKGAARGLEKTNAKSVKHDPFGGIASGGGVTGKAVALSETARIADRGVIRDLTDILERSLKAWTAEVKTNLDPAVHAAVRGISGQVDAAALTTACRRLKKSAEDCDEIIAVLRSTAADLRTHEEGVGG